MPEFIRSYGRIIHTKFTAAERKAINEEASKIIQEASREHEKEELAIVGGNSTIVWVGAKNGYLISYETTIPI